MLESLVVHDQHDEVDTFDADLQSPASSANGDERRCAPAAGGAAGGDASTVFTTENEAALNQVGNYHHALCIAQHFFWNPFVGSRHNGMQNIDRRLQARDRIL